MSTKTIAIRLEEELHAQLAILAQLEDSSITEEIRQAIFAHIQAKKGSVALTAQADEALAQIERDASTRRDAITALFGTDAKPATSTGTTSSRSRAKKSEDTSGD